MRIRSCFHLFTLMRIRSCFHRFTLMRIRSCFHLFTLMRIRSCFHLFTLMRIRSCFHLFIRMRIRCFKLWCGSMRFQIRIRNTALMRQMRAKSSNGPQQRIIGHPWYQYRKVLIFRTPFWLCDVFSLSTKFFRTLFTSHKTCMKVSPRDLNR